MDNRVIAEYLKTAINGRKVISAVFTTYVLDIDFFETEIIPELFPNSVNFSLHADIRRAELDQLWSYPSTKINIDVFYDASVAALSPPFLDCNYHPVKVKGAFHPKVILLLLDDDSVLVLVGSNNLTEHAWRYNIECFSSFELSKVSCPKNWKGGCLEVVDFLNEKAFETQSLELIKHQIEALQESDTIEDQSFYFQSGKGSGFLDFLATHGMPKEPSSIQIVSPFFEEEASAPLLDELIRRFEPKREVLLFLPIDYSEAPYKAILNEDYYQGIKTKDGVDWAEFSDQLKAAMAVDAKDVYRKVHAKVFVFDYDDFHYLFVGSVNFSQNAFKTNVEGGALIKFEGMAPRFLEATSYIPEKFEEDDEASLLKKGTAEESVPLFFITYDWFSKELSCQVKTGEPIGEIVFSDLSGVDLTIGCNQSLKLEEQFRTVFEQALINNSLFNIHYADEIYSVIVNQKNIQGRPVNYSFSIQQLIQLYSALVDEAGVKFIAQQIKRLKDKTSVYFEENDVKLPSMIEGPTFFSEFTEINKMFNKLEEQMEQRRDYYLYSEKADSFNSFFKLLSNSDDQESEFISFETKYLMMLSMLELVQRFDDKRDGNPHPLIDAIKKSLIEIKSNAVATEEELTPEFFAWFETNYIGMEVH